jgi:hypothetical protein
MSQNDWDDGYKMGIIDYEQKLYGILMANLPSDTMAERDFVRELFNKMSEMGDAVGIEAMGQERFEAVSTRAMERHRKAKLQ